MTLNPYLGARWWWIEAGVAIEGGLLDGRDSKVSRAWADPVAGLFIRNDINDRWFVELTGDVGGGVSIVSWQLYGGTLQLRPLVRPVRWLSAPGHQLRQGRFPLQGDHPGHARRTPVHDLSQVVLLVPAFTATYRGARRCWPMQAATPGEQ